MKKLIAGLVQQNCTNDREANLEKSVAGIREAASRGAELVVLQELHLGRYFCQTEDAANFDLAERFRTFHSDTGKVGQGAECRSSGFPVRAACRRTVPQHGGAHRKRRLAGRHVP